MQNVLTYPEGTWGLHMQFSSVMITGGAGFIGSHLTDKFLYAGAQVRVIDNLQTGLRNNLARAETTGQLEFIEADVIRPFACETDLVVNLACAASPPRYQADPIHTMLTNVQGALNAATVARANNARLVHTSTSEVYGDPECHPQNEDYRGSVNPIGPRACYDEGKRAAETVLFDCHRKFALEIGVCRIFNTYGPRMDPYDGRVVSNFLRQALQGKSITIYGDGTQTRSFCYVDDMVDALWQLCLASKGVTGPINLGNPNEMTILELAETIRELVGAQVYLAFRPIPVDDPKRRRPDISRAKAELGWEPRTALREGLTKTLDYFDDIISSGMIDAFALQRSIAARGSGSAP